ARSGSNKSVRQILLDTSVIIDGRIADIARTGFLSGELLIPGFVLNELQYIADSSDNLRRQRGRRGLEVLAQMQKDPLIPVNISDIDVEGSRQVDDKLVILAKQLRVPVLTNDFNLNRVAELQGVTILNINELANAVKAVYLPGEVLPVRVIQEGRESGQGVGYLDDGTMVVVQGGNNSIGIEMNTVVTKVLQTAAGRMIFARIENSK
ncbi:MAG: TRAM domain-containing protein, partial [Chloroflexi bacterium]|nr:TRAM domain-containing protein [Chloroflexota bacterium]